MQLRNYVNPENVDERVADVIAQTLGQIRDTRPSHAGTHLALWFHGFPEWILVERVPWQALTVAMIRGDNGVTAVEVAGTQIDLTRVHGGGEVEMNETGVETLPVQGLTAHQIRDSMLRVWDTVLEAE